MEDRQWFDGEIPLDNIQLGVFEEFCKELIMQKRIVEEIDSHRKIESEKLEKMKARMIALFEQYEKSSHKIDGLGSISVTNRFSVKMPKDNENRQKFFDFLRERGIFGSMATVHSKSLNAFYKNEMDAAVIRGDSDYKVPGLEDPTSFQTLSIRKG